MKIDIQQKNGHYEVYINGQFYGSYDTMSEAAKDADSFIREKESN